MGPPDWNARMGTVCSSSCTCPARRSQSRLLPLPALAPPSLLCAGVDVGQLMDQAAGRAAGATGMLDRTRSTSSNGESS